MHFVFLLDNNIVYIYLYIYFDKGKPWAIRGRKVKGS
ncbi:hypothetical protein BROSI_A1834 [Candidatus Brocadia sinica JPN1]|uniref:Uncharacterized protein n=1 Tax=Candidatus Brocadia sinica JPN1 TaxID=1197129 RepID=A0ABQ0JXC7_9BACT|nr:hypothetical protein BROSI_A1834 [Candidatus Brocadia sinica JPN1]